MDSFVAALTWKRAYTVLMNFPPQQFYKMCVQSDFMQIDLPLGSLYHFIHYDPFPPLSNLPELLPGALRGNQDDDIGSG